jgi:hypothetical protein
MALPRLVRAFYVGKVFAPNERCMRVAKRQPAWTGSRSTGAFGLIPVRMRSEQL